MESETGLASLPFVLRNTMYWTIGAVGESAATGNAESSTNEFNNFREF
jgi:hypothetical protein